MYKYEFNVPTNKFLIEAEHLLKMHWEELALNKDTVFLKPDVVKYNLLQETGILHNIVVYNNAQIVVGYCVLLVQPNLHYSESIFGYVDVIYVDPAYRNSTIGARLLIAVEKLAKELKVNVLTHHAKPNVPMIIRPLEKLGYSLYEYIYGKLVT
jgi:GNAT superfamily N-acetyltransferase